MIQSILVVGSGSAGLIAALSLKRKIPAITVRIVRSPEIGVIGVGEGTTPNFPTHLFDYLGISRKTFYEKAGPSWKLGVKFLWGPRGKFFYSFAPQLDSQWSNLSKPHGFYCDDEFSGVHLSSALMEEDLVFNRQENGAPEVQPWHAFHIENRKFVDVLEQFATEIGVEIIDGKVIGAERGDAGVTAVRLEDGRTLEADFFIDSTGFRSELLGKTLGVPYKSFAKTLFTDRAVVGGWERTDESIQPYTTAETMDSGWCWQVELENHINRGYVFSSQAISDDDAADEYMRKNPKFKGTPRVVKYQSGCYEKMWVDNVVAIGNSAGFVEPLESTALMIVCSQSKMLVDFLLHSTLQPTQTLRNLYNDMVADTWDDIRDFLGLHYKLNTALDTPFWKHCREETDLSGIGELLEFYYENGPTGFCRYRIPTSQSDFGIEGYFNMLVGNKVPYRNHYTASAQERAIWNGHVANIRKTAKAGIGVKEALAYVRHPGWTWNADKPPS